MVSPTSLRRHTFIIGIGWLLTVVLPYIIVLQPDEARKTVLISDAAALAEKMICFIEQSDLIAPMGKASRSLAEQNFCADV